MQGTSRISKKSLSLGSRKHGKRISSSPQNRLRAIHSIASSNAVDLSTSGGPCSSASVATISSDCGIEFTSPHKKISFDDSLDYSPHSLDCSFSPTGILSQTLSTQSPEVSWRWNRAQYGIVDEPAAATPDSSYMSAGSSEILNIAHASGELQLNRVTLAKQRQERRRAIEQQKRKAEKLKMDEMLKRRCVKLQKQLKEGQKKDSFEEEPKHESDAKGNYETKLSTPQVQTHSITSLQNTSQSASTTVAVNSNAHDSIDDFFNDTESDGLLLAATQQLELKIAVEMTQKSVIASIDKNSSNSYPEPSSLPSTPKSSHKEKNRTSFYSKFLEDDSDDWFVSLDEVALQAIQNVKPRTSLQRYKSMPTDTMPNSRTGMFNEQKVVCTDTTSNLKIKDEVSSTINRSAKSFKRHVSSHSVSPSITSGNLGRKHLRSRIES